MLTVDSIRPCLEGAIPAIMTTSDGDGIPNVAYLSQVEYIDRKHVALSFQLFNKTRANILVNPRTQLIVIDPRTGATYRLQLVYLRTETEGPLFERMKAKLAGIASHTGMAGIFKLRGADIYRVDAIAQLKSGLPQQIAQRNVLAALRACAEQLHRCNDLDALFDTMLEALQREFAIAHSLFLLFDRSTQKLFAVASHGYENSGVGGEICLGDGVIGVAAQARTPIRIGHTTSEYGYGRAVRAAAVEAGLGDLLETEIPLPGLPESRSQMAVPIIAQQQLLGVLYVESPFDMRFGYDEEDALAVLATQIGNLMLQLQLTPDTEISAIATPIPSPSGAPAEVRYYAQNHSVFLDGDYLIKGVAGAIFWTLAQDYVGNGKRTFSNRQLRLDQRIRLPELSDNLEARLILLSRRLQERSACVRIEKCGRGQFELVVQRPLTLIAANT